MISLRGFACTVLYRVVSLPEVSLMDGVVGEDRSWTLFIRFETTPSLDSAFSKLGSGIFHGVP